MIRFQPARKPDRLWRHAIDRGGLARDSGYTVEAVEGMFRAGLFELHEIRADGDLVGVLVLYEQPPEAGSGLVVFWVEVWARRAMRAHCDWLVHAAAYLAELARQRGCRAVIASVAQGRDAWQRRLERVGFGPTMVQLEMKVPEVSAWVA